MDGSFRGAEQAGQLEVPSGNAPPEVRAAAGQPVDSVIEGDYVSPYDIAARPGADVVGGSVPTSALTDGFPTDAAFSRMFTPALTDGGPEDTTFD